jgi:LemA protein
MTVLLVVLGIAALLVIFFVGLYNGLVQSKNEVKNAWSQIDVQLKRRHDLIPNLLETAKGYMQHERATLDSVTQARSQAMGAQSIPDKVKAESALGAAMSKFLVTVENYPDLKANQNFLALQEELSSTENRIAFSRQNYNDQVLGYNNKIQMVPSNIVAGMFNFTPEVFFEIEDKAHRQTPQVKF